MSGPMKSCKSEVYPSFELVLLHNESEKTCRIKITRLLDLFELEGGGGK